MTATIWLVPARRTPTMAGVGETLGLAEPGIAADALHVVPVRCDQL